MEDNIDLARQILPTLFRSLPFQEANWLGIFSKMPLKIDLFTLPWTIGTTTRKLSAYDRFFGRKNNEIDRKVHLQPIFRSYKGRLQIYLHRINRSQITIDFANPSDKLVLFICWLFWNWFFGRKMRVCDRKLSPKFETDKSVAKIKVYD